MFQILLHQTVLECDELKKELSEFDGLSEQLEGVISSLGSLSGMGEVIGAIRSQKNDMEIQRVGMLGMLQALERISFVYDRIERKICDNGEESIFCTGSRPGIAEICSPFSDGRVQQVVILTAGNQEKGVE